MTFIANGQGPMEKARTPKPKGKHNTEVSGKLQVVCDNELSTNYVCKTTGNIREEITAEPHLFEQRSPPGDTTGSQNTYKWKARKG